MLLNHWWSQQIPDTVRKDSALLLLHGLHMDLQTELNFWKARKDNILFKNKQKVHLESPENTFISWKYVEKLKSVDQYEDQTYKQH